MYNNEVSVAQKNHEVLKHLENDEFIEKNWHILLIWQLKHSSDEPKTFGFLILLLAIFCESPLDFVEYLNFFMVKHLLNISLFY